MDVWKDLRTAIADLADRDPSPLRAWPGFSEKVAATPPPHSIWLAAWAADVAEQLHQRYGADVELKLGALCYPERRYPQHMAVQDAERRKSTPVPRIDETEISVALDGPVSVRSGHTTTCRLLVGNLTADELTFVMGPLLVADVVDPGTGDIVGGYSGLMDLIRGNAQPHHRTRPRAGPSHPHADPAADRHRLSVIDGLADARSEGPRVRLAVLISMIGIRFCAFRALPINITERDAASAASSPAGRRRASCSAAKRYSQAAALRCIAAAAATRPSVMLREDSNCHPALPRFRTGREPTPRSFRLSLHSLPSTTPGPRPTRPAGRDPRQPHRPHRRSRTRRLARRDRRTHGQPHRRRGETCPARPHRPATHRHARHAPHRRRGRTSDRTRRSSVDPTVTPRYATAAGQRPARALRIPTPRRRARSGPTRWSRSPWPVRSSRAWVGRTAAAAPAHGPRRRGAPQNAAGHVGCCACPACKRCTTR